MNNVRMHFFTYVFGIACLIFNSVSGLVDRTVYFGTIEFPADVLFVPSIRIWHEGVKVPVEADHESQKLSFELSVDRGRRSFYLVITDELEFEVDNNTVKCFKLVPGAEYLVYFLELSKKEINGSMQLVWTIHPLKVPLERIPDDAVIVYCPASFVENVVQVSAIEFPKIILKSNLLELAQSSEKLGDIFSKLRLQAINYDTVHDSVHREIKIDDSLKTVLALNVF